MNDVRRDASAAGIREPGEGDAVLFRTGHAKLWKKTHAIQQGCPVRSDCRVSRAEGRGRRATRARRSVPARSRHPVCLSRDLITMTASSSTRTFNLEELAGDKAYEFAWSFNPVPIKARPVTRNSVRCIARLVAAAPGHAAGAGDLIPSAWDGEEFTGGAAVSPYVQPRRPSSRSSPAARSWKRAFARYSRSPKSLPRSRRRILGVGGLARRSRARRTPTPAPTGSSSTSRVRRVRRRSVAQLAAVHWLRGRSTS